MANFTAARAASTFPGPFSPTGSGVVCAAYGTYAVAAIPSIADIGPMCRLPAGAVVLGGHLYGADLDTGTETLDIDVGWAANGGSGTYDAADPDGFGNFGVVTGDAFATGNVSNVAGINYPLNGLLATGVLPSFTAETIIQVVFNAAANAFTAGSISVVVFYVVP